MNKILDKKISFALKRLANEEIQYSDFVKAIKWEELLATQLKPLVYVYVETLRNTQSETVAMAFAQKLITLRTTLQPLSRICGLIKRRRFNFDMIEERGTFKDWKVSVVHKGQGIYEVNLPEIYTTISCTRDTVISVYISLNQL